jgi:RHS repeat-associated protein
VFNYSYSAFGINLFYNCCCFTTNTNPFRFAGEYWDWEIGEYYLRARSFNPRTGRFTQPDPFWGIHNMQSSTNAIMQAANLYVYVMNNPIMWRDPLGLFAWNERDDQWIRVTDSTTRNAGGTFTRGTGYVTIDIWGVNVSFHAGTDGVSNQLGTFMVRADTFYQAIVRAAGGEIAFLGGHTANIPGASAYHMHIAIFAAHVRDADNIAYNRLRRAGSENIRWGVIRYGYISGGSSSLIGLGGRTHGQINATTPQGITYMTRANRQFFHHLGSGAGTGANLFGGLDHFMDNHSNSFWWSGRWTNSTSFTIGLVNAMGHSHGLSATQIANSWGIDNAFSARHFGR